MKTLTNLQTLLDRSALFLTVVSLSCMATGAAAQEKAAERTMRLLRSNNITDVNKTTMGDTRLMSCPKCKDTWAHVVQPVIKGNHKETALIQRHQCPGCETRVVTKGAGKQVQSVAEHRCSLDTPGKAACCDGMKRSGSASGMGKHV